MKKFHEFLEENTPANVFVSWEEVEATATLLELTLEEKEWRGESRVVVSEPDSGLYTEFQKVPAGMLVEYRPFLEEEHVVYKPRAPFKGACGWENLPGERLVKELSAHAPEVTIALPERVVSMPAPGWVSICSDDPWSSATGKKMFESEARTAFDLFSKNVRAVLEG